MAIASCGVRRTGRMRRADVVEEGGSEGNDWHEISHSTAGSIRPGWSADIDSLADWSPRSGSRP